MATPPVRLLCSTFPPYRAAFVDALRERVPDLELCLGGEFFKETMRLGVDLGPQDHRLANVFLLRRRFLWQRGAVRLGVGARVAVLELNPWILSVWVVAGLRRLRGRPSLFWGHAWSRSGRSSPTNHIRGLLRGLGQAFVAYTVTEADELRAAGVEPVFVATNAITPAHRMGHDTSHARTDVVYCGRLVDEKKVGLLVEGFARASLPGARLVIVGAGPERAAIEARVRRLGIADRVELAGEVFDHERLRDLYARAVCAVSPGYAGLAITQSLSFGVPIVVADHEPHAPEIEALRPGETGELFASDDPDDLARVLGRVVAERATWEARGPALVELCRTRYSAESMADGMAAAIAAADR